MLLKSAQLVARILYALLILCVILVTATILFLSHIDLDDYRKSLEQQLSSALNQPVTIGRGSLTYSHGLALELEQFQIGAGNRPAVKIPRLLATLELKPLLDRQFILKQVDIENPQFNLTYPVSTNRPEKGTSHRLFNSLGIDTLSIQNARAAIYQADGKDAVKRFEINNLHAYLQGWQANKSGRLVVSAHLPRQHASLLLETSLPASTAPEEWRREAHDLKLEIRRFSTAGLPRLKSQEYPESLDLVVTAHGTPDQGARLQTLLTDSKTDEPLFSIEGLWTSLEDRDTISELTGSLLGVPLAGNFRYDRQADANHLSGDLGAEGIELNPQLLKRWRIPNADKLLRGTLDQLTLSVDKSWPPSQSLSGIPRIDSQFTLSGLDWAIPELKQFQDLSVELNLIDEQLTIKDGILVIGGEPVEFGGTVNSVFLRPTIDLTILAAPSLSVLTDNSAHLEKWAISGSVPSLLHLNGALANPAYRFEADLSPIRISHPWILRKESDQAASLALSGSLSRQRIEIGRAEIKLGPNSLTGSGSLSLADQPPSYEFRTAPLPLAPLRSYSPLLERIKIVGEAGFEAKVENSRLEGLAILKDAGAHLTTVIADLKKTSGQVRIDNSGLSFSSLRASLGESEFTIDGLLSDWKAPLLSLDIQADQVRAHDIIFPNPERVLHDLNGVLRIDGDGIRFAPVNVRLEDDTVATVSGSVTDFSDPRVALDIQAETVDVLDVIDLFSSSGKRREHRQAKDAKRMNPVLITVSAKQGTLGGLKFTNAEGLIRDDGHLFTLYPLRFENGEGWSKARIDFIHDEASAPLRISGHVEGINASVLHQDIFRRPGLISGDLFGDFYLEGNPGNGNFWKAARGGIHLEVKKGVLRKFHGLAKVFSLLNVSQLFAGKLPDMDKEGMPFSRLVGSAGFGQGKVVTEDLAVVSEAMNLSMVGSLDLVSDDVDFTLGVMPLRTVDKVITKIPIAGWILTGENKALLTAYFKIKGPASNPQVSVVPVDSVSKTVFGIFRRTLGLPGKLVEDVGSLFKQDPEKKTDPGN